MRVLFAIIIALFGGLVLAIPVKGQEAVTLYSPLQYNHDQSRGCFDFQAGAVAKRGASWDLAYGLLRAGDDFDWFQSAGAHSNRGLIRDLGKLKWTDEFTVPVIEPLPKLEPGEQRVVSVDVSGADGADGAPGPDGDGMVRQRTPMPTKAKHDGQPKIDPIFVKAIIGHLYAIHVVDDTSDFYALFRVEALTRGDNCTISWRLVPAPLTETVKKEK